MGGLSVYVSTFVLLREKEVHDSVLIIDIEDSYALIWKS